MIDEIKPTELANAVLTIVKACEPDMSKWNDCSEYLLNTAIPVWRGKSCSHDELIRQASEEFKRIAFI